MVLNNMYVRWLYSSNETKSYIVHRTRKSIFSRKFAASFSISVLPCRIFVFTSARIWRTYSMCAFVLLCLCMFAVQSVRDSTTCIIIIIIYLRLTLYSRMLVSALSIYIFLCVFAFWGGNGVCGEVKRVLVNRFCLRWTFVSRLVSCTHLNANDFVMFTEKR